MNNMNDHLYKNAFIIMLKTITGAGSGFIFWIVAARYYSPEDVGLAVGILSAIGLLSTFTRFGLDIGIIRYLPNENNKLCMVNSCLIAITLSSLFFGILFMLNLEMFLPGYMFIKETPLFILCFLLFLTTTSIISFQNNVFIALRDSKYSLLQSILSMSRILLLPLLISLNFVGIYFSYGIGILVATIIGNNYIWKIIPDSKIFVNFNLGVIKKIFSFSFGNYLASLFEVTPGFIFPLIITNVLSSEMNAYFYVSWSLSSILFMIPKAIATSLFVEGSYSTYNLRKNIIKSLKFILALLIPMVIILYFFGNYVLALFGAEYSTNAFNILKIFAIGTVFYSINEIYISIKRVQKETLSVIYIYGTLMVVSIITSYILMVQIGLVGVAFGWLLSNAIMSVLIGSIFIRNLLFIGRNHK